MQLYEVVHDVREIHQRLINSQYFIGYSAGARFGGGVTALFAAVILALFFRQSSPVVHLIAWGIVFVLAVAANYFMLYSWLKSSTENLLSDAVVQPLFIIISGGLVTFALVAHGHYEILSGVWMTLFGLANISAKRNFSRWITLVGYFYIAAGWAYLAVPKRQVFENPWPMGLIFFIGEAAGAYAFYCHNRNVAEEDE